MTTVTRIAQAILILAAVLLTLGVGGRLFMKHRLPAIDGTFTAPALSASVTVTRDDWGIPHIEAGNAHDAHFALGFTVAQDRLFQMEIQRRVARGELSEILGPATLKLDTMFRTYLFRQAAENYLKEEKKRNPEALAILDAYLAGINHCVATQPLPVEFTLLRFTPRPFTRIDLLSMMGFMAYSFAEGFTVDSLQSMLREKLPGHDIGELFPGADNRGEATIMEPQAFYRRPGLAVVDSTPAPVPRPSPEPLVITRLGDLPLPRIPEELRPLVPLFEGSNSWVIAPSRSSSGRAILANDPHIALSNPGVWYEAHVRYGDYENYGYHLPMIPFPLIGHNRHRAWALTMFENDDLDIYRETFNPADESLVMYRGAWQKVTTIRETIRVKGGKDVELTIRVTPHGPVITDCLDGYQGPPVSLSWVFLNHDNPALDALYGIAHARTMPQFARALADMAAPGLNFSWADAEGNIAWWAVGKLPIRPAHVNSKTILDGASGRDEILGYLPFEQNPHLLNPPSGIIITANNRPTMGPTGPIRELEGYWHPSDRAARLLELLSAREKWSVEELKMIQTDLEARAARDIVPVLTNILGKECDPERDLTAREREALRLLISWDRRAAVDSGGAVVYHMLCWHILRETLADTLGEKHFRLYLDTHEHWNFLKNLVKNERSRYWDKTATPAVETRRDTVLAAFRGAVAELSERLGRRTGSWTWGRLHTIEYVHPLGMKKPLNLIFNIGPLPAPGEAYIVNRLRSKPSLHDYRVISCPSTRRLVDFADPNHAQSILPSGNAGNVMSPYYDDQVSLFLAGKYRTVVFSNEDLARIKNPRVMTLVPQKK